jgi:crossover junction endodeoxyribonuclease RuvC
MKVLGIDPGLANLGWAVVSNDKVLECGVIKTQAKMQNDARLLRIFEELELVIDRHELYNAEMANERLPYMAKMKSASSIGEVIGVLGLLCSFYKIRRYEYSPMAAKKSATGDGRANKDDMIKSARDAGWTGGIVEHSADAIAIARMHLKAQGNAGLRGM